MATSPHAAEAHGYEKSDASPRALLYFAFAMAAILAAVFLFLIWLFKHYEKTENPGSFVEAPFAASEPVPPPPRVQADPAADMQSYLQSQQNLLNTYGWIDRQSGVVRMPIDRAMELLLERGLPTRQANAPQNLPKQANQRSSGTQAGGARK